MTRGLALLGSTGSIGQSALEVVAACAGRFRVLALAAGRNVERLAAQIARFAPELVSVEREQDRAALVAHLAALGLARAPEIEIGTAGAEGVARHPAAEVVLCAMVGAVGLRPALAAIRRGVTVAIANKEPLVMAGSLCIGEARRAGATIVPVDSEHSAIFQSLRGHRALDVARLWLTGSGGPFRGAADLSQVTPEQALRHPSWAMGRKITVDSATLMNKGLEVIEARWLFEIEAERIAILIHPECVVHSLVEYVDGSTIAQLGLPDMRVPISYALGFPERLPRAAALPRLDLLAVGRLSFEAPSLERFPCLGLAYRALAEGGSAPAALNAANEVAVAAFLERRLPFDAIPRLIERVLDRHRSCSRAASDLGELLEADRAARALAETELAACWVG
jgi:1-deoxy-D-xylulose-5-phosphate reductoisomerase